MLPSDAPGGLTPELPRELRSVPATVVDALAGRRALPEDSLVIGSAFRLTFGEADLRSQALAGQLLAAGVGKGSRVGVLFGNSPSWVIAWLAVARIGGLTVPLSTFSPGRELARTIRHDDVGAILTTEEFAGASLPDRLEQGLPGLAGCGPALALDSAPFLRWIHVEGQTVSWSRTLPDPLSAAVVAAAEGEIFPSDALAIISTSGSTSAPKAVVHTHASLVRHAAVLAGRRGLTRADRIYSPMPFFWVGGLTMVLLAALTSGCGAVVQERFEPLEALELAERERVTQISCWPNASQTLAAHHLREA
jgi:acyl-CoA synthetase (AMP-forming)/AMP-acid ligase II